MAAIVCILSQVLSKRLMLQSRDRVGLHNLDLSDEKVNLGAGQQGFMNCRKVYCAQQMNTSDPPIFINVFFIIHYINFNSVIFLCHNHEPI